MDLLEISSFEKPPADYLNRSLNDFGIDLLYSLNASAVENLSSPRGIPPVSECQLHAQECKHLPYFVDRLFVGQPTIDSNTVAAIDEYCAADNQALFKFFIPQVDANLFIEKLT